MKNLPHSEIDIFVKKYNKTVTVLVDDDSKQELLDKNWFFDGVYAATYIDGKRVRMHRYLMNAPKGKDVDHINGNKLDNRKSNLRVCTRAENTRNRKVRKDSKTGIKGINYRKDHDSYTATIVFNRKRMLLGERKSLSDAIKLYNEAATKYFGEFARLNNELLR